MAVKSGNDILVGIHSHFVVSTVIIYAIMILIVTIFTSWSLFANGTEIVICHRNNFLCLKNKRATGAMRALGKTGSVTCSSNRIVDYNLMSRSNGLFVKNGTTYVTNKLSVTA
jgi:hypothetical protein